MQVEIILTFFVVVNLLIKFAIKFNDFGQADNALHNFKYI